MQSSSTTPQNWENHNLLWLTDTNTNVISWIYIITIRYIRNLVSGDNGWHVWLKLNTTSGFIYWKTFFLIQLLLFGIIEQCE